MVHWFESWKIVVSLDLFWNSSSKVCHRKPWLISPSVGSQYVSMWIISTVTLPVNTRIINVDDKLSILTRHKRTNSRSKKCYILQGDALKWKCSAYPVVLWNTSGPFESFSFLPKWPRVTSTCGHGKPRSPTVSLQPRERGPMTAIPCQFCSESQDVVVCMIP